MIVPSVVCSTYAEQIQRLFLPERSDRNESSHDQALAAGMHNKLKDFCQNIQTKMSQAMTKL
jgi:hypothetical protein